MRCGATCARRSPSRKSAATCSSHRGGGRGAGAKRRRSCVGKPMVPAQRQPRREPGAAVTMFATFAPFATLVLLLVWMGFFMLGSLPLMILKHDTPLDARFIRGLFDVYYKAVMVVAAAGTLAHALAGRPATTAGLAAVGGIAFWSRREILSRMDRLRVTMTADDAAGIRRFRRLHVLGMVMNFVQLLAICVALPFVL